MLDLIMRDCKDGEGFELIVDASDGSVSFSVICPCDKNFSQLDFDCSAMEWSIIKDGIDKKLNT